jgi:hypothetical protein
MRRGAIFATAILLCVAAPSVEAEHAVDVDGTGTNGSAAAPTTPSAPESNVTDESITNNITNNVTSTPGETKAEPEVVYVPVPFRETCTTVRYGKDFEKSDCRTQPLTTAGGNPALEGICTVRYGMRTCY